MLPNQTRFVALIQALLILAAAGLATTIRASDDDVQHRRTSASERVLAQDRDVVVESAADLIGPKGGITARGPFVPQDPAIVSDARDRVVMNDGRYDHPSRRDRAVARNDGQVVYDADGRPIMYDDGIRHG